MDQTGRLDVFPHLPVMLEFLAINYSNFYGHLDAFYPLLDDKILDWSKLKQIEDDILKYI